MTCSMKYINFVAKDSNESKTPRQPQLYLPWRKLDTKDTISEIILKSHKINANFYAWRESRKAVYKIPLSNDRVRD